MPEGTVADMKIIFLISELIFLLQIGIIKSRFHYFKYYLKASPLPPAPLAVAGFMVAGVVAWQYSDRLAGLMGFAVCFLFC